MLYLDDFCAANIWMSAWTNPKLFPDLMGRCILGLRLPTPGLQVFEYNMAGVVVRLDLKNGQDGPTPAKTLVMSSTRMPASGSVGEFAAAIAKLRCLAILEPLSILSGLTCLARHW